MAKEPKELTKEREALLGLLKKQTAKGPFAPVFAKLKQLLMASGTAGTVEMWIKLGKDLPAVLDEAVAEIKKKGATGATKKDIDVFGRIFDFTHKYVAYVHARIAELGVQVPTLEKPMPKRADLDSFRGDAPANPGRRANLLGDVDAPIAQTAGSAKPGPGKPAKEKESGSKEKEKGKEKKWVNPALGKIPIR